MDKQKKISTWLKGLTVLLVLLVVLFFAGVTRHMLYYGNWYGSGGLVLPLIFCWYTAVLCCLILFDFWKVCAEIGKDNSFSLENAASFHKMNILGIAIGIGYIARLIYAFVSVPDSMIPYIYAVGGIFLSAAFAIICEALSQLIKNAYEVKLENELTI